MNRRGIINQPRTGEPSPDGVFRKRSLKTEPDGPPRFSRLAAVAALAHDVRATRRAFKNWVSVGVIGGIVMPSRIPPVQGAHRLMHRRLEFRTQLGPTLKTELGNAGPIVEVFRDSHYDAPINWNSVHRVLDVGGHVGAFASWVATRAPDATIVAFEPESRNFTDLAANVDRNGLSSRIELVNAAVAPAAGTRVLNVPVERNCSSFADVASSAAIEVSCIRLQPYLRHPVHGAADLLKLDCEGAEWEILASLERDDMNDVRYVLMECHAHEPRDFAEMQRTLERLGFSSHTRSMSQGSDVYPLVATLWADRN
jgi:FkbM family methyltransferase